MRGMSVSRVRGVASSRATIGLVCAGPRGRPRSACRKATRFRRPNATFVCATDRFAPVMQSGQVDWAALPREVLVIAFGCLPLADRYVVCKLRTTRYRL